MVIYTIGVYGSTETEFFDKLLAANIDLFCDIRQRRGVRGREYAFVNAQRLEQRLAELQIAYEHIKGLAPTKEIRLLQKEADLRVGVQKKERKRLGDLFEGHYTSVILDSYDLEGLYNHFLALGAERVVLFCVEQFPQACHRSLVADRFAHKYSLEVIHL